ncbi:MAG TPA: potassium transporter TrkG [Ilumatobacteraceae bacterium]|nr:potassium transporter TrkG [Ilumatobacteraceae bacterium]
MASGGLIEAIKHPARLVVGAFVALIMVGTILLSLPIASDGAGTVGFDNALFMATSAATVTGLASLDVGDFSVFGEIVIMTLMQVGGFGIMTIGSVLVLVVWNRVGLRQRMLTQAEIGAVDLGELKRLLLAIAKITLIVEGSVAFVLTLRFWQRGDEDGPVSAAYSAVFHSIAAFNNSGLSLYPDNLTRFVGDPVIVFAISAGFIIGGLGFPIIVELRRRRQLQRDAGVTRRPPWSLHARITLLTTAALIVVGVVFVTAFEWANPATLGPLDTFDKLLAGWFQGVSPRTAGFNTVDIGGMHESTLVVTTILMFIGAGPASTSGGIKVTTFAVLAFALWSEVRGSTDVNAFRRRIPPSVIRQGLTVVLLSIGLVITASLVLMGLDDLTLTPALFEVTSAFGTVGLSTGITPALSEAAQVVIVLVMLAGRVGPVTFVTALALREHSRAYRYPEERPIIG